MDRGWYVRFSVVLASIVLAWCALWPSLEQWGVHSPGFIKSAFSGRLSPGLDIRGGLRLMYEVEVDEYVRDTRDRRSEQLLRKLGVKLGVLTEAEAASPPPEKLADAPQPRSRRAPRRDRDPPDVPERSGSRQAVARLAQGELRRPPSRSPRVVGEHRRAASSRGADRSPSRHRRGSGRAHDQRAYRHDGRPRGERLGS